MLASVNREYRMRPGKPFMSYGEVQRRLRKLLAGAAATGSAPADLVLAIFEG
jgi:hypothetical protein